MINICSISINTGKNGYRKGFTLAEILISLMILGVIASLTIPSLIQNTTKKEEVVKVKKGLSMINQALGVNYSLTNKNLSDYSSNEEFMNMLKTRMSIVDSDYESDFCLITQDGLGYRALIVNPEFKASEELSEDNCFLNAWIVTKPESAQKMVEVFRGDYEESTLGHLTGIYKFICSYDRCVPTENTAAILDAANPTKPE